MALDKIDFEYVQKLFRKQIPNPLVHTDHKTTSIDKPPVHNFLTSDSNSTPTENLASIRNFLKNE
jgi:hypothetical protein